MILSEVIAIPICGHMVMTGKEAREIVDTSYSTFFSYLSNWLMGGQEHAISLFKPAFD